METIIGIDISKEMLDAYCLARRAHNRFPNSQTGHAKLIKWLSLQPSSRVIFEATGAYHRALEETLCVSSIPFVKVNPKQARRFAQACGRLAKTDRVDCEMLAKMGDALKLPTSSPTSAMLHDLRELLSARRALIKDRTAAKARMATVRSALLVKQLSRRLCQIESDIQDIDAEMLSRANKDRHMIEKLKILSSIPGIGQATALIILIEMPEIGTLDNKRLASLAGLAPMSQSSGTWRGKARIQGGRGHLRHAIFMPSLVAIRYNPDMKAKYDQLIAAGKEKKVAITVVMRKLLILANALLRNNRKWTKIAP